MVDIDDIHPPMPITQCGAVGKCMSSPASYADAANPRYGAKSDFRTAEYADRKLEDARQKDIETHKANEAAIAHNTAMRTTIIRLMEQAGIEATYRRPKKGSRSFIPKQETVDAGFVEDLRRVFPVNDGFSSATTTSRCTRWPRC